MHSPILQEYPAEGSREIVERELLRLGRQEERSQPKVGPDDILRLLGELSPDRIAAILALDPTPADLALAALWSQGDGDVTAAYGHTPAGKSAAILDIVRPEEAEIEP